ncbi:hypothetical protein MVEN_00194800 [Mycena venus]|uniref:F-box domain-containing protein n=1 Tax=Mycena venus TaxID=2733690 RepID=A0A8H6Z1J8_9AGAR|nr:hypothetical protein MVEN_00194800 [Mycena venus]
METITDLSIFSNLASKCPSLKHFIIYHNFPSTADPNNPPNPWDKATPIISRFVEGLNHLETLYVPSLDDMALAHLSKLPSLTALSSQSHPPIAFSFQPPADSLLFPVLERLKAPTMAHEYSVGGDTIEPLLSFVNLTSVHLSHPVGFDLDDAMVLRMARAWPCITSLSLLACPSHRISPRVTLRVLYAFAKHCPELEVLEMTFDATKVPKIRINGKRRRSQWSLSYLNVGLSPISKPRLVASFLSVIFPELAEIGTLFDQIVDDQDEVEDDEELVFEPEVIASYDMWEKVQQEIDSEQVFSCLYVCLVLIPQPLSIIHGPNCRCP